MPKKVRKIFYLTKTQSVWVKKQAKIQKVSESQIIREVIGIAYPQLTNEGKNI